MQSQSYENIFVDIYKELGCVSCRASISFLSWLILNPYGYKAFEVAIKLGCSAFLYGNEQCEIISIAYVRMVMTNLKKKTFEPNYFCEMFLGVCKPEHYKFLDPKDDEKRILADKPDFIKDNNYVNELYKEIEKDRLAGRERETMLMYHISDLHMSIEYKAGTNND